jgi:hypothetical protein
LLQLGPLLWNDRTSDRTHLQTNAAVNAGIKINPKPISTLDIFARTRVNASNRTSADAISNSLANIRNDSMWHSVLNSSNLVDELEITFHLEWNLKPQFFF